MNSAQTPPPLSFAGLQPVLRSLYQEASEKLSADLIGTDRVTLEDGPGEGRFAVFFNDMALSVRSEDSQITTYLLPRNELVEVPRTEYPSRVRVVFRREPDGQASVDGFPVSFAEASTLILSTLHDLLRKAGEAPQTIRLSAGQTSLTTALRDLLTDKQRLVATLFAQQEQLYKKLSMELHDSAIGDLVLLQRQLRGEKTCDPTEIAASLEQSIQRLRDICADLSSREIADWGLVNSLQELCNRNADRSTMTITFTSSEVPHLPYEICVQLYRIAQESITNAVKYSSGKNIKVCLSQQDRQLVLEVRDDGGGIKSNPTRPRQKGTNLGLKLLKERAELISASFVEAHLSLESTTSGTSVVLTMNLDRI